MEENGEIYAHFAFVSTSFIHNCGFLPQLTWEFPDALETPSVVLQWSPAAFVKRNGFLMTNKIFNEPIINIKITVTLDKFAIF